MDTATEFFNIYRQLYYGAGVTSLAKEFAFTAKDILDKGIDFEIFTDNLYQDMQWCHDGHVPVDRETWFYNTRDLLGEVVDRMKKYPVAFRLKS